MENIPNLTWTTTEININKKKIQDLTDQKFDLLSMFGFLPDIVPCLFDNEIKSNLYPGTIRANINKINTDQEEIIMDWKVIFAIDGVSSEKKDYFKKIYLDKNAKKRNELLTNLIFIYDIKQELEEPEKTYELDVVQDISGRHYFIYNAEEYIQELANLYICFFCTGMLCRYYPDYWMHWIEKNVGFKHLMETLCSIGIRKFPNLILNQLTQCINHFHL